MFQFLNGFLESHQQSFENKIFQSIWNSPFQNVRQLFHSWDKMRLGCFDFKDCACPQAIHLTGNTEHRGKL